MSSRVTFVVDDGDETYVLDDVPVPQMGTRIDFDGHRYDVKRPPVIVYWTERPENVSAEVHITRVIDQAT